MKKILLLIILLLISFNIYAQVEKKLLFISSYHPGFVTFFQQVSGLQEALDGEMVILDIEFMDMKRFPDDSNRQRFIEYLDYKLSQDVPYDILIVGDDYAFNFALEYQERMFRDIPIIFLGVNNDLKAVEQNSNSNMTGIIEAVSMNETVDFILSQMSKTGRIIAISDNTDSGKGDKENFLRIAEDYKDHDLSVLSLEDYSWQSLLSQIKEFNSNEISFLLLSAYTDLENKTLSFSEGLAAIKLSTEHPVYHLWEHGIGTGLVGGKVISHFNQGEMAGQIAKRVLAGELVEEITVIEESPNQFLFDFNELKRQNISLDALPPAEYVNIDEA